MKLSENEKSHRALKRLLANGPLTALPKRPADQELLLQLAASRFDARKAYRESEVNGELSRWLETFCSPFGIDHVTMRRLMVDSRLMTRDRAGSSYRVSVGKTRKLQAEPAQVLAEIRAEREARKKERAAG
jgi:hypothetical protein